MASRQCFIGVDLGAESGRVMAGLFDGNTISLQELHRFPNGPVPIAGTLRWDLLGLWNEIQKGLTKAADEFGDEIVSIGVDTWGVDYVLMDGNDELLGLPYNYRDPRTDGMLEKAFQTVSREDIFANSGLQFMEINSLYQLLAMREQHPELLDSARRFLMIPDFFNWCLAGSHVVEFTNATTSQCYHPTNGNWATNMLEQFGLPTRIFPDVVQPGTRLGKLRESVAKITGLKNVELVAPATHDTGSAVVAVPTKHTGQPNWAYISSGTWSLMGVEVQNAILTEQALARNVTNEGGVDGTYRLLKNIMGLWLIQQSRRAFERRGHSWDYSQLTMLAQETEPFRSLIDPDDHHFLNPDDMPTAIQEQCRRTGQPLPETEGQIIRCALESLALKYRRVLSWIEELTGTPVEVIHIVGGGTQNELLNQFTANACEKPVITGPIEATVLGNFLLQARSMGEVGSLSEIREIVARSSDVRQYDPADSTEWQAAVARFDELFA